jgi:hypothetical protein
MATDHFGLRRILGATFFFGSAGTGTELLLLEHVEGIWQIFPIVVLMGIFAISGLVGVVLHYQGNVAFELELSPDAEGFDLFWEAMHGATPALAPGTMILLGAVGLAYARLTDHPRT